MQKPLILAVVLNYIDYESTEKCVESILIQNEKIKIVIVDNNSPNDSFKYLKNKFPLLDVIQTNINSGYAKGNNFGIRYGLQYSPDYILVVNNDIILTKCFFHPLLRVFKNYQNAVIVTPKIINPNNIIQKTVSRTLPDYYTLLCVNLYIVEFLENFFHIQIKIKNKHFYSDYTWDHIKQIEVCSGACFLINSCFFKKIGLFDNNTFLFGEEFIIGKKIKDQNKAIFIEPHSIAHHNHSKTISTISTHIIKLHMLKSHTYYLKKYLKISPLKILIFQFIIIIDHYLFYWPIQIIKSIFR